MSEQIDAIVIGAGVVGLAIARALSNLGKEVIIVEANSAIGMGTSSRNSEVIHAGIYYEKDSLKARLCVQGRKMLYDFCDSHGVPCKKIGKLIVASTAEQIPLLEGIREKARQNHVSDLELLDEHSLLTREPQLKAKAALFSPSTGIIDSHAYMLALLGDAQNKGTMLALNSPVLSGDFDDTGMTLHVGGVSPLTIKADIIINAAGLSAIPLAQTFNGLPASSIPRAYYCKGNYFSLAGKAPFSHLIYPIPEEAGLGVHLTLDMGGQARFGPDVEWLKDTSAQTINYEVDPQRSEKFYRAIRTYWPQLGDGMLHADYSGVRPKIQPQKEGAHDFIIQGQAEHGILGLINLYAIESPGLTASLAIASEVINRLEL